MSKVIEEFLNNSIETLSTVISHKLLRGRQSQKRLNKIISILTTIIIVLTIIIAVLVAYAMYVVSQVDWDTAMAHSPIIYIAVTMVAFIGVVLFKVQTNVKKRLDELKKKRKKHFTVKKQQKKAE